LWSRAKGDLHTYGLVEVLKGITCSHEWHEHPIDLLGQLSLFFLVQIKVVGLVPSPNKMKGIVMLLRAP
jgi:hypothetical protein